MMPWERQQPQQPQQPQQAYRPQMPPPNHPYPQPMPDRQARPEVPIVARNPQTGETVRVDIGAELREAIRQAVTQSVVESRQAVGAKVNDSIERMIKTEVQEEVGDQILEERFSAGATTQRTFLQNIAVDMGVAVMAVVTTVSQPTFDLTDRAAWLVMGTSLVKTLVTTAITWGTRIEAK